VTIRCSGGLSTYKRLPGESPEEEIVRLIEMIEDHHGEFAHTPPWSEIEVIGAHVDPQRMEATARDVGATSVVPTPEGCASCAEREVRELPCRLHPICEAVVRDARTLSKLTVACLATAEFIAERRPTPAPQPQPSHP
jgi:hypothetical protein